MGSQELLLEAGKSAQLGAALRMLAENELDGEAKFSPSVCREVTKYIVCRTYASPILELCHLVVAATRIHGPNGRYEYFFWDSGVARPSNFRSYSHNLSNNQMLSGLTRQASGLKLTYPDGTFHITFSRMPVLSALLEFMLTALGYSDMDTPLQEMLSGEITQKTVSACASQLSKDLYAYLKDHLPTVQSQRKFHRVLDACQNDIDRIDNDLIFNFWSRAAIERDKTVDFKTFSATFLCFIRLIQAVEAARDLSALNHAAPIGSQREEGEIDPDILSEAIESIEEKNSALLEISTPPLDEVKFLNKQESQNLEILLTCGALSSRFARSVLRCEIFTKPQARLTQALRRQAHTEELFSIIAQGPAETYESYQNDLQNLQAHITLVTQACLYVLSSKRSPLAIGVLMIIAPKADYQQLAPLLIDQNIQTLNSPAIAERFLQLLHNPETVGSDIANLMAECQQSFDSLSRKGFKGKPENFSENQITAFSQAPSHLQDIKNSIEQFLSALHMTCDWKQAYQDDCHLFTNQFKKIYGVIQ